MKDCNSIDVLLKFLLLVDVLSLVVSVSLAVCAGYMPQHKLPLPRITLLNLTVILGVYGLLSMLCNFLASHGVKSSSKVFLLPYLLFYPLVVTILTITIINSVLTSALTVETLLLPLGLSLLLTLVWLRFVRLWYLLSTEVTQRPRRGRAEPDLEWSEVNLQTPVRVSLAPEQPPAYDSPPGYEEAVSADHRGWGCGREGEL